LVTSIRHGKPEPEPTQAAEESRLDAATFVLGYIDARAQGKGGSADAALRVEKLFRRVEQLTGRLAELETVEQQAAELRRSLDTLKAHNERLQETIRTLEIGFRRHVSERLSPDQLRLALAGEPSAPLSASELVPPQADADNASPPPDAMETGDASKPPASSTQQLAAAEAPSGSEPNGRKRPNRNNHGRRRIGIIPRLVIETVPPDVLLKGIENFELVGTEDSSSIGYRRGGLIELVTRRPKYVLKGASAADASVPQQPPAPSSPTAPAIAGELAEPLVVREHEALMIPADPGFKRNPFVDGAIVRFVPDSTDLGGGEEGPVWIAPLPERPIDRSLADPSLRLFRVAGRSLTDLVLPSLCLGNVRLVSRARVLSASLPCGSPSRRVDGRRRATSTAGRPGCWRRRADAAPGSSALCIWPAVRRALPSMTAGGPSPLRQATCGAESSSTLVAMLGTSAPASPDRRFAIAR
jgi:hypothetical protein